MGASQTLQLIEKLTEANIPKETATELLEFVEQKQTDLVTKDYFETKIDAVESGLSARIDAVESGLNARINAVESGLKARIDAVESGLNIKINGLRLFVGFNTALSLAILIKLFLG